MAWIIKKGKLCTVISTQIRVFLLKDYSYVNKTDYLCIYKRKKEII